MKGGFDQAVGGRRLTLQKMTSSCKIEFELWRLKLHDSLFWKASPEKQNWAPFSLSFIYSKYFFSLKYVYEYEKYEHDLIFDLKSLSLLSLATSMKITDSQ